VREVLLAKSAGFCFGVRRAVELAAKALAEGPHPVHTLGPIIHNPIEVDRLGKLGLRMADSLEDVAEGTVVIRSHGAPRGVIEKAQAKGLRVVDATCPFVKKVEERVCQLAAEGYFIVISGDPHHPEVEALVSYAPDRSLVVGEPEELAGRTLPPRVGVVAQTTQSMAALKAVAGACLDLAAEVRVFRTNCHATVRMREEAREMAGRVDVMVVVGGKNSANTRRLAETARSLGKPTFLVEDAVEAAALPIPPDARVGLTAGASTPPWLLEQVAVALLKA
jgi:(E)-4-hydroxy-3-methyl-but-2-enyl pyrophosphate reductase